MCRIQTISSMQENVDGLYRLHLASKWTCKFVFSLKQPIIQYGEDEYSVFCGEQLKYIHIRIHSDFRILEYLRTIRKRRELNDNRIY